MRTMRGVSNALVAGVLALLLVAALPLAAAAEGAGGTAFESHGEGSHRELAGDSGEMRQTDEPDGGKAEAAAGREAAGEGAEAGAHQARGESAQAGGNAVPSHADDAPSADPLAAQGGKGGDPSQAADLRAAADAVISIDASGDTTLELKEDGTYELTGAVTGSGPYDSATSVAMAEGLTGTLTLKGTGSLASATLVEWPDMGWEPAGFDLVVAAGSSVAFSDVVECMNLTVYGTLKSQWAFSGDEYRWYAVGCYGAMVVDGGAIDVTVRSGAVSVNPVMSIDSSYGLDGDDPVVPQSRIVNGGSLSVADTEGDGWGSLLALYNADLLIENGSLSLTASNDSGKDGIGGYGSRVTVNGGSIAIDVSNGSGASLMEMVLGTQAAVTVNAGYNGISLSHLKIGAKDASSNATITTNTVGTGLEVTESTSVFGAGKDSESITVSAGSPDEYGWIGAVLRGAHLANTKVSSEMVSKEAIGLLISCNQQAVPTFAAASVDPRDESEPEPEIPTAIIENSTIVATGTDVGLETDGDRFLISDSDIRAVASGNGIEGMVAPLATPVTYPMSAIRSSAGLIDLDNTTVDASGSHYGWLSVNYMQPADPYDLFDDGDDEWDWESTRIAARNGSNVEATGDIAGIALAGSLEATSGASVTGTARLTDPYEPEANDVAAIDLSNYKASKNEIKADGGAVTERYVVPVSETIADNEHDAFNPYAGAWHMASPAHYAWTADHPAVLLEANEHGVYTTSGTGGAETGLTLTATRTAPEAGEKVALGVQDSAHNVVLLGDIKPQDTVKYLVQFEPNGGVPKPADQMVARGSAAVEPSGEDKPMREGYALEGWYADEALKTPWSFDAAVMGDTTLYAKWIEDDEPVPPGPVDPDPVDPDPDDPKPVDTKPASTGKTLARTGDSLVLPIVAAAVLLGAGGVAVALGVRSAKAGRSGR